MYEQIVLQESFLKLNLFYVYECYVSMCVSAPCGSKPVEARRRHGSPGTAAAGGCWPPCRCWEWNPDALEEEPLLLTIQPSLQATRILLL